MSLEEFTSFVFQARHYLVPLARLTMRFCIRFMLDFSSETGMFQGFLDRVLGDFEGEDSVGEVFVFGFIVDLLELFSAVASIPSAAPSIEFPGLCAVEP